MRDSQKLQFALLMNQLSEATANAEPPSREKIDFYFECLKDLELDAIRENAIRYVQTNKSNKGFFPPVAYLRDPREPEQIKMESEAQAQKAFERVQFYLDRFYVPELHGSMLRVIEKKMAQENEGHLFPWLQRWGSEIMDGNQQVVRAQFVKAFVLNGISQGVVNNQLGSGNKVEALGDVLHAVNKLIEQPKD